MLRSALRVIGDEGHALGIGKGVAVGFRERRREAEVDRGGAHGAGGVEMSVLEGGARRQG